MPSQPKISPMTIEATTACVKCQSFTVQRRSDGLYCLVCGKKRDSLRAPAAPKPDTRVQGRPPVSVTESVKPCPKCSSTAVQRKVDGIHCLICGLSRKTWTHRQTVTEKETEIVQKAQVQRTNTSRPSQEMKRHIPPFHLERVVKRIDPEELDPLEHPSISGAILLETTLWARFDSGSSREVLTEIVTAGIALKWRSRVHGDSLGSVALDVMLYGIYSALLVKVGGALIGDRMMNPPGTVASPDYTTILMAADQFRRDGKPYGVALCFEELGELGRLEGDNSFSTEWFQKAIVEHKRSGNSKDVERILRRQRGEGQIYSGWFGHQSAPDHMKDSDFRSATTAGSLRFEKLFKYLRF